MKIKQSLAACLLVGASFIASQQVMSQEMIPLIPKPEKATKQAAVFELNSHTKVVVESEELRSLAAYFQSEILTHTGISVRAASHRNGAYIALKISPKLKINASGYRLSMTKERVEIVARDKEGLFLGISSLLQLVRQRPVAKQAISLPCWDVEDSPRYAWRGMMLDESRHFFGMEKVKQLLDWMAFYKLNKFHWHLTDEPGWRVEIKAYPRLTLVGGVGTNSDSTAPAQYYTQEQIKEVVRYASERFIEVIPEIDMPGHARAANRAYPAFSGGGSARYPDFTFNPGKEETYSYLTNILREVDVLFPSQKIHIGADEVHFGNQHWNKDADVQRLMKEKAFSNLQEVEHYFVKRMADSLQMLNNEVLSWDETVTSGLSPENTTVFWWRHDKPNVLKQAVEKGFKVILCPRIPLYFDFVQKDSHKLGRKWAGAFVPIDQVYQFPSEDITAIPNSASLIQGLQANLWTENFIDGKQIDYMIFPRIAALAESAWTAGEKKDFNDFSARLKKHFKLYAEDNIYYFDPIRPENSPEWLMPKQRKQLPDHEELTKQEKGTE